VAGPSFSRRIVAWQRAHGRHALPWQNTRDPYRVWLSEIMLQQTQVAAVIPYYARFLARFPTLQALADAPSDDVMAHWAGLGYYSRARNLHAAARQVCERHGGDFPHDLEDILALPGVGRSTAAAIAAFCFGTRAAIMDGNVKRVFARQFGITGYPGEKLVENKLWALAEAQLPHNGIEAYTQGLMDLGATVCTRSNPTCLLCPVRSSCVALREGRVEQLPSPKPSKPLPLRHTTMPVLLRGGAVWLIKRPDSGIWGGLWCLPQCDDAASLTAWCKRVGVKRAQAQALKPIDHGFTHYKLTITALRWNLEDSHGKGIFKEEGRWVSRDELLLLGLPAPVRTLLTGLGF
jgi:A/G-specific adenine glycosylase